MQYQNHMMATILRSNNKNEKEMIVIPTSHFSYAQN